jgi:S-adenosylmethionine:tRNA-ribosyltransferase-isomerase (queuine synthetase)
MVMNNTGVIPARIVFTKDTGGKVEGLFLYNEGIQEDGTIPVIVMKQIHVGRRLFIGDYGFSILRQHEQYFYLKPDFEASELDSRIWDYAHAEVSGET